MQVLPLVFRLSLVCVCVNIDPVIQVKQIKTEVDGDEDRCSLVFAA